VEPVDSGVAPVAAIVARGRGSRTRRRGAVALAAAASVAAVVGATALLGRPEGGTPTPLPPLSSGPSQTVTEPVFRDVSFDDLIGAWRPVSALGVVPEPATDWGEIWFHDGQVFTSYGCTYWHGPTHSFGGPGDFDAVLSPSEIRSCLPGAVGSGLEPDSGRVLREARRITLVGDELTFVGSGGAVLGTYTRNWLDVSAGELSGRWRPIRLFGEEAQRINGRVMLLSFYGDRVSAADGVNTTSGTFAIRRGGIWTTSYLGSTLVGCGGPCARVRNPDVIESASRVQFLGDLLAFFGADSHLIGLYRRA